LSRGAECGTFGFGQRQSVAQSDDGVAIWKPADTPFEISDGTRTETRSIREFFLCQASCHSVLSQ
jgi:hypothetical protein